MAKAALTIIFLGAQRTDRVDLGPGPAFTVLEKSHKALQGPSDPAERVEASLISTPRVGKVVWVLWEGASSQVLDMPRGVVEGMEREQLAGALGFEIEPLTGVPAAESAIDGFQLKHAKDVQPEFRRFWITQLTTEVRNNVEQAVLRSGAKFGGITHPGGLPRDRWDAQLAPEAPHEWRRVEIWDQVTFSLHGTPDGNVDTRVVRSTPGSEGWVSDLPKEGPISLMTAGPTVRTGAEGQRTPDPQRLALWDALMTAGSDGNPVPPVKVDFPETEVPEDWLRAWAAELTFQKRVPTVQPPSRVSPYRKYYVIGSAAASITLVACLGHAWWFTTKTAKQHDTADRLELTRNALAPKEDFKKEEEEIRAQIAGIQPHAKELEQKESGLEAEIEKAETLIAKATARKLRNDQIQALHRPAVAQLLASLAESERDDRPTDVLVKEVRQATGGDLRLSGLCTLTSSADAFAQRLQSQLERAGWQVGAAEKFVRDDQQAFDFTIILKPIVLTDVSPSAPRKNAEVVEASTGGSKRP